MRYVSKPTECEAMQWTVDLGGGMVSPDGDDAAAHDRMVRSWLATAAEQIVAWVNDNGGEARYEPSYDPGPPGASFTSARNPAHGPCIAVRTKDGWKHASPGWYVVMGSATFYIGPTTSTVNLIRDFYPCDPETFEELTLPATTASAPPCVEKDVP